MTLCARALVLSLAVVVVVLSQPGAARAQNAAQAEDLFNQGRAKMQAGEYETACKLFKRSLELDKAPVTALNLAKCYEQTGQVASAWGIYTEVRDTVDDEELRKIAADGVRAMEPRLPRLEVKVAHEGASITVDGAPWVAGVATAIDPGKHTIEVSADGYQTWTGEATTEEGKTATVEAPALEKAPDLVGPGGPGGAKKQPSKTLKYVGLGTAGLGVASMVVGGVFGLGAMSAKDDAVAAGCNDDLSNCPNMAALDKANDAYDKANSSTTFFVIGGVLVAGGVVMYILAPSSPKESSGAGSALQVTPTVGPDVAGVTVNGRF